MPFNEFTDHLLKKGDGYLERMIRSHGRSMSPIQRDFLSAMMSKKRPELIQLALFKPIALKRRLESVKESFDEIIASMEEAVEEAWERVKNSAREDMAAALDDEKDEDDDYEDPDQFNDYDVFEKYDKYELLNWMGQEIGHNVEGRNKNWDRYVGKNAIRWNDFNRGIEDIDYWIVGQTVRPLEEELDQIYEDLRNKMMKLRKDYNASKPEFIKQLFEEGKAAWIVDAWIESDE